MHLLLALHRSVLAVDHMPVFPLLDYWTTTTGSVSHCPFRLPFFPSVTCTTGPSEVWGYNHHYFKQSVPMTVKMHHYICMYAGGPQ